VLRFATLLGVLYAFAVAWVIFSTVVTLFVLYDARNMRESRREIWVFLRRNDALAKSNWARLQSAALAMDEIEAARERVRAYAESIGVCPNCRKQPGDNAAQGQSGTRPLVP